jgi:hypothetical protein
MISEQSKACCFRGCFEETAMPDLRIEVYSTEEGSSTFWGHEQCFTSNRSIFDRGRIVYILGP